MDFQENSNVYSISHQNANKSVLSTWHFMAELVAVVHSHVFMGGVVLFLYLPVVSAPRSCSCVPGVHVNMVVVSVDIPFHVFTVWFYNCNLRAFCEKVL